MFWLDEPIIGTTPDRQIMMKVGLSSSEKSNIWCSTPHDAALFDRLTTDPSTASVPGMLM